MSVFEVRGGNDRRSMIKRYERKSKQDAIRELVDLIHCNWSQIEQLEARPAVAVPDGYALVPFLPTPEMVRAAEDAHMPFGDMELAVRMAIMSAPATAAAPPSVQQAEPLHITHRPLIRNAINLLGIRRPVAPDVARVIEGLEAMLEGAPTPTHSADEHWLEVARVAEAQQLEQQSEEAA